MANTFAPFGLQPFGQREGASPTAGLTRCFIASSDAQPIFCGDTVKASTVVASSNTNYVSRDTDGGAMVRGVFMGCEYYSPTVGRVVWSRYWPGAVQTAGPDAYAYVIDNPDQLFIAQGSTVSVLGSSNIGTNIGVIPSSLGNTTDGHSVLTLFSSGPTVNSSWPFRLVDTYSNYAPPGANGVDNTVAAAIMVVAPNNWERKNLTARATQ